MMQPTVYFIRALKQGPVGPIKIGFSENIAGRLAVLGKEHGAIEVLATVPGGLLLETYFHKQFCEARLEGEWFRPTVELYRLIEDIQLGNFQHPSDVPNTGTRSGRETNVDWKSRRVAIDREARFLVKWIAGDQTLGTPLHAGLAKASEITGIELRRVRAFWNQEANGVLAVEIDRLREIADAVPPPTWEVPDDELDLAELIQPGRRALQERCAKIDAEFEAEREALRVPDRPVASRD